VRYSSHTRCTPAGVSDRAILDKELSSIVILSHRCNHTRSQQVLSHKISTSPITQDLNNTLVAGSTAGSAMSGEDNLLLIIEAANMLEQRRISSSESGKA